MKAMSSLSLMLVALLLVSCNLNSYLPESVDQQAKGISSIADEAVLYIYRYERAGLLEPISITLDDKSLPEFFPKSYYLCVLEPGNYRLGGGGANEDFLKMKLEAGKSYYIEITPRINFWGMTGGKLERVDASHFQHAMRKCKIIGTNKRAKEYLSKSR